MNLQELWTTISARFRSPCGPDNARLKEIQENLSRRKPLSHLEWHMRYAADEGIPFEFVVWFRETCSRYFEYDLSAALPEDRLMEDLGMCEATWSDVDDYILNAFERWAGVPMPQDASFYTFGEFLKCLWKHAERHRAEPVGE